MMYKEDLAKIISEHKEKMKHADDIYNETGIYHYYDYSKMLRRRLAILEKLYDRSEPCPYVPEWMRRRSRKIYERWGSVNEYTEEE